MKIEGRIGAGLVSAAALLVVYGILTGGPPPSLRHSSHMAWISGLLFVGAALLLISGCRSSNWVLALAPGSVVGAFGCVFFPRGLDPNPMPPAIARYGYPYAHGVAPGCVVADFPYLFFEHGGLLLLDLGAGLLIGLGGALFVSLFVRAAVDDSPSCPPPSPPRSAPSGSST